MSVISRRDLLAGSGAAIAFATSSLPRRAFAQDVEPLPPKRPFRAIENEWIVLRDGTRLASRLWLPEGAERNPVPVVWEYLPYRTRDRTRLRDDGIAAMLAPRGIAYARVDIRGTGNSEGVLTDEYDVMELSDGIEVVEWLAKQRWCNGSVGMRGLSWGGINALQIASQDPPALKAIMPMGFVNNRFGEDAHYAGGCLLYENYRWGCGFKAVMAAPPDPEIVGADWETLWRRRLDATPPILATWTSHQRFDAYWQRNTIALDYGRIKCPVYAVAGWLDPYSTAVGTLLENLSVPRKGLIGPWGHVFPHEAAPMALDWAIEEVRWWRHWLEGVDTGLMDEPMFRAFMPYRTAAENPREIPGRWIAERSWPPPRARPTVLHFNSDRRLAPAEGPRHQVTYVSEDIVGTSKPRWMPAKIDEQSADDRASLVFDSVPLAADTEIVGYPSARIRVAADKPAAKLAVRLNEVLADGTSWLVTYGLLNLAHRASMQHPTPLRPGEAYDVTVQLYMTAHRFKKGSRLRVAISEGLWPLVWPSPERAKLEVTLGVSSLSLPIRSPPDVEAPFTIPTIAVPAGDPTALVKAGPDGTGEVTIRGDRPVRSSAPLATGTILATGGSEYYAITAGDPSSGFWRQQNIAEYTRGDWRCAVVTGFELTSTPAQFHLREYVRATKDGAPFFERDATSAIAREFV